MEKYEIIVKDKFDKIKFSDVNNNYKQLYGAKNEFDTCGKMLNFVFAYFHQHLNSLLELFNTSVNSANKHFTACNSRELISLIDSIYELKNEIDNPKHEFIVREEYDSYLKNIKAFLKNTNGTDIPIDTKEIKIIKYKRIFILNSEISEFVKPMDSSKLIMEKVSIRNIKLDEMSIDCPCQPLIA